MTVRQPGPFSPNLGPSSEYVKGKKGEVTGAVLFVEEMGLVRDLADLHLEVDARLLREPELWNSAQRVVSRRSGYARIAEEEEPMAAERDEVDG